MVCKKTSGTLPSLSTYMVDSFCKEWIKYLLVLRDITANPSLTSEELLKQVKDLDLVHFDNPSELIQHSLHRIKQKRNLDIKNIDHDDTYAVIPKDYQENTVFKPGIFSRKLNGNESSCITPPTFS